MEALGNFFHVGGRKAKGQRQRQVRSQVSVSVQMEVQPCVPSLVEPDAGHYLVTRFEGWRQPCLEGAFPQNSASERVERADVSLVEIGYALAAPAALLVSEFGVRGGTFQPGTDAVAQLGGGGLSERDGSNAVQRGRAGRHQVHHPLHEAGCLSGTRAGLHEQRGVQFLADHSTRLGVDRSKVDRHRASLQASPARSR